jgi:hypothetical protein
MMNLYDNETYIVNDHLMSRNGLNSLSIEDRVIVRIIIEKKGMWVGTNGQDQGRGKYLPGFAIRKILKENPEWIRTKVASKKFGL